MQVKKKRISLIGGFSAMLGFSPEDLDAIDNIEMQETKEKEERMNFRLNRLPYMFYPEDVYLDKWNLLITIVLLFTSIVTPARIAFVQDDTSTWIIINIIVDLLFTIDIIVVFNSAFYTEDFQITDDRKEIAL